MMASKWANLSLGAVISARVNAASVRLIHASMCFWSNGGNSGFFLLTRGALLVSACERS